MKDRSLFDGEGGLFFGEVAVLDPRPRLLSDGFLVDTSCRATAAMRIYLRDHRFVDDLCAHFTRSGFSAAPVEAGTVEVAKLDAMTGEQERREVTMHLRVWGIVHPGATVTLLG